jgi:integrase
MIQDVLQTHEWRSMKTRSKALIRFCGIFDLAVQEGGITMNPVLRVKRIKSQRPMPGPSELSEVDSILDWLCRNRDQQYWNYFEFAFFSGLRTSEQIALTWSDIDLQKAMPASSEPRPWAKSN